MKRLVAVTLITLAAAGIAGAQPEDRERVPTASPSASPCIDANSPQTRGPQPTWPGFDPRLPAPTGATSFTGVAPMGRDPSRGSPDLPLPPHQASDDCVRRMR
jgi:hypothetical protein